MERIRREPEEVTTSVLHTDSALEITADRRITWHFSNSQEANKYFRRNYFQFNSLLWGMRLLVLAGIGEVARNVDQAVQHHDLTAGGSALAVSGIVLIVQGLNQRAVGERVRLHREVVRRLRRQVGDRNSNT
jgi:hypothetical protein